MLPLHCEPPIGQCTLSTSLEGKISLYGLVIKFVSLVDDKLMHDLKCVRVRVDVSYASDR